MANYLSTYRSNMFKVNDEQAFLKLRDGLSGEYIEFEAEKNDKGETVCFIGGYGGLDYYPPLTEREDIIEGMKSGTKYFDENGKEIPNDELHKQWELYDENGDSVADRSYADGDMDVFYKAMQKLLPDNEAFVMVEAGNEKLRYVGSYVVFVTNKTIEYYSTIGWVDDMVKKHNVNEIIM